MSSQNPSFHILTEIDTQVSNTDPKKNMAGQQEEEVTLIQKEFAGRCRIVEGIPEDNSRSITLQPKDMDLTIKYVITGFYPSAPPRITIRASCMEEEDVLELQTILTVKAKELLNQPMMSRLVSEAETWLKMNGFGISTNTGKRSKSKKRKKKTPKEKMADEKLASMKTADNVVKRIQWDFDLPQEDFIVGYLDRFLGIKEKYFTAFSWEDIASVDYNVLAIPKHRIQYFKYKDVKVWDKLSRLDNVFGSLNGGKKIHDIIQNYDEELALQKADETQCQIKTLEEAKDIQNQTAAESESDSDDGIIVTIRNSGIIQNVSSHPEYWQDKLRPNYFIAIRIRNPAILEATEEIQTCIIEKQPIYRECCIPQTTLHITLCTLGLDTQDQVDSASRVLNSIKCELKNLLPAEPLVLDGVSNFYGRVIYAKVKYPSSFMDFVEHVSMCLRHEGVEIRDQHDFVPHMSIMKTSRGVARRMGTANIEPRLYEQFCDKYLGEQIIDGIYLCSMGDDRQSNGFYISPTHINF